MLCCLWDFRSVHLLGIFLCILRPLCTADPLSTLSTARSEGDTGIPLAVQCLFSPSSASRSEFQQDVTYSSKLGDTRKSFRTLDCTILPADELCRFSLFDLFALLLVDKSFAIISEDEVSSLLFFFLYILRDRKEVAFLEHFAFFPGSVLYES